MPTKLRQASGSGFDATLAQEERGAVEGVLIRLVLETRDPPRSSSSKPAIPPGGVAASTSGIALLFPLSRPKDRLS